MSRLGVAAAFLVSGLLLTSCGGAPPASSTTASSPPSPASSRAAPADSEAVSFTVRLGDYSFTPKDLTVPLGARVKLTIINDGEKRHDFNITGVYAIEGKILEKGASEVIEFTADKAGEFTIVCSLRGHRERGMVGTFTVK